jgi:uncharacterized alkaline shock family protein YloU
MKKKMTEKEAKTDLGAVRIRNEVVSAIASVAALEVKGVVEMKRGITQGMLRVFGKKSFERGVRVNLSEGEVKIDISVIVEYGAKIPEVAKKVQENVKKSVEEMTGLSLVEVNVNIRGVSQTKPGIKEGENESR